MNYILLSVRLELTTELSYNETIYLVRWPGQGGGGGGIILHSWSTGRVTLHSYRGQGEGGRGEVRVGPIKTQFLVKKILSQRAGWWMRAEQRSRSLGQNDSMTQFPHAHYRHHTVNNLQRTRDHFGQLSPGPGPGATLTTPRVVFIFITTPPCRPHFCGLGPNTIKMLGWWEARMTPSRDILTGSSAGALSEDTGDQRRQLRILGTLNREKEIWNYLQREMEPEIKTS